MRRIWDHAIGNYGSLYSCQLEVRRDGPGSRKWQCFHRFTGWRSRVSSKRSCKLSTATNAVITVGVPVRLLIASPGPPSTGPEAVCRAVLLRADTTKRGLDRARSFRIIKVSTIAASVPLTST